MAPLPHIRLKEYTVEAYIKSIFIRFTIRISDLFPQNGEYIKYYFYGGFENE